MVEKLSFLMPLNGRHATKEFSFKKGKWECTKNYKSGKWFRGFEAKVKDLRSVYGALKENQNHPVFFVHGSIIKGTNKEKMVRRKRDDHEDGLSPTIKDKNLRLFCLDIDGYKDDNDINNFIMKNLPEPFRKADYIYQYSASYGLTTTFLNCHLFFWLKNPIHNVEIKEWIKNYNKIKGWGNVLDDSILSCTQPIYIQKRIVKNGLDPIKNFIGYVEKEGELDWKPQLLTERTKTSLKNKHDSNYDLTYGVEKILTSENYHEELNKLALSLINKKVPANTAKQMLEGAMNAAKRNIVDDKRLVEWQTRFDDIKRSVDSAADIVNNPTIEDVLEWIYNEDTIDVKANFAQKCLNLSPIDRTTAVIQISKKIGFGVQDIKRTIKIAEQKDKEHRLEEIQRKQTEKRKSKGIQEITLTVENSYEVVNEMCDILANSNKKPEVYVIGDSLATVGISHPKSIRQCNKLDMLGNDYPKMPIVQLYKKPYESFSHRIKKDIMLIDESGKDIEVPWRVINAIGEARDNSFKPLTGIVENPFIDNKWGLVRKEGYNKKTGLCTMLHHKLKLTKMETKDAWDYLAYEVFDEFPFSSDLDRAVAVSALMTAVQRPTIAGNDGFPGFGIVSPIQSSGKTTMAQLISYSIFNRPIAATNWSNDEEELGKHLLGILQEGHSCVLFDNIQQGEAIQSGRLANAMSTDIFSGRQLGENKTIQVPSSVLWLFTGNGIKFCGDFATRIYPININPKMEDPNTRVFKREDICQWAMDNRKKIMSAVLSVVLSGKDLKPFNGGSRFKLWDIFVRRAVLKISGIDINDAVKKNQVDDPIAISKANLMQQLYEVFGDKRFTTKDILDQAFNSFEGVDTNLGDSLIDVLDKNARNKMSVGKFLGHMVDAVFSGFMLKKRQGGVVNWYIEEVDQNGC